MSYEEIDEICDELKVDSIPFYNAIEFKGKNSDTRQRKTSRRNRRKERDEI